MKTLLVALDFSDAAQNVSHVAVSLARQLGAKLNFIHVVEPIMTTVPIGAAMDVIEVAPAIQPLENLESQTQQLTSRVASIAQGVEFTVQVISGMAVDEILEQAKTVGADFIILGSHGRGAIYHLFAGSVVTAVLKQATVPVIVVPIGKR